jgi:hypothetical protein
MNNRMAEKRSMSSGSTVSSGTLSGGTAYSRSPRIRSTARLVTTIFSEGTPASRPETSLAASRTCSKLSRTSSAGCSDNRSMTISISSWPSESRTPRAVAIVVRTRSGEEMAANDTYATSASSDMRRASSMASRVLPIPPGPVSETRRISSRRSRSRRIPRSSSRPINGVGSAGRADSTSSSLSAEASTGLPKRSLNRIARSFSISSCSSWGVVNDL